MELLKKLEILADAAKYDASCSSSGSDRKTAAGMKHGIGSTEGMGICHAYAPDGRCISLLKILLTNFCVYDCLYCVNRRSSNVRRARFTPEEVVDLTLGFYRRNYIEGLFLSSGIIQSPDYTMEQIIQVARTLREQHGFRGYIHLKTIPDASPELLAEAGRHADRLSINIELPVETSLGRLAPEKDGAAIRRSMGRLRLNIEQAKEEPKGPRFAPGGQSTQMIVGADATDDKGILATSDRLYNAYRLRRVYYSAFSPIPDSSSGLPPGAPTLMREHRLYQADWLMRFYSFEAAEIVPDGGLLDLEIDPKLAWALANRQRFPVDVNKADRESLLRVPGMGVRTVDRLLSIRRHKAVRLEDLGRLRVQLAKVAPFIITADRQIGTSALDRLDLRKRLMPKPAQLSLPLFA
jgi:putative DNA modification/repair radical SAM protein